MKKQILILLASLTCVGPAHSIIAHGHGGAIAGGIIGGAALTGIIAGAAHHHRHYHDYDYDRDLEEENAELREQLAEQQAQAYDEDADITPTRNIKTPRKARTAKVTPIETADEEEAED